MIFDVSKGKDGAVNLALQPHGFKTMTPVVAFLSYAWAQFLRSF